MPFWKGGNDVAGRIVDSVQRLVEPILADMDLELFDLKYVKEGKHWFLRVFIDSPQGVDLDICTVVSERLSEELDQKADFIDESYYLEVSSPGVERLLRGIADFKKAVGKDVRLTTYEVINGQKELEGRLALVDEDQVTVSVKQQTHVVDVQVPIDKIASARLAIIL